MVNNDIHFLLPTGVTRAVYDKQEVYETAEAFSKLVFNISVHGHGMQVDKITILKNGVAYADADVLATSANDFRVTEHVPVVAGNSSYGARVVMNDGKVYERHFFLKIRQAAFADDVKFTSLTAYGLYENFSTMRVIAVVDTPRDVFTVTLYKRVDNSDFVKLGVMTQLDTNVYTYDDLLFFIHYDDPRIVYKAVIRTVDGHTHSRDILVTLKANSVSLNEITAWYTKGVHTLKGGMVCRVGDAHNRYAGAACALLVHATSDESVVRQLHVRVKGVRRHVQRRLTLTAPLATSKTFAHTMDGDVEPLLDPSSDKVFKVTRDGDLLLTVEPTADTAWRVDEDYDVSPRAVDDVEPQRVVQSIDIVNDDYVLELHMEGFEVQFPRYFNPNRSDISPNVYIITGKALVTLHEGTRIVTDTARVDMTIRYGIRELVDLTVTPDNGVEELTLVTGEVANSVVLYADSEVDGTCVTEDTTVSADAKPWLPVFANGSVALLPVNDLDGETVPVASGTYASLLADTHWLVVGNSQVHMYRFTTNGVSIRTFDGLNSEDVFVDVALTADTVSRLRDGRCPIRYTVNGDREVQVMDLNVADRTLRHIKLFNNALDEIDWTPQLTNAYTALGNTLTYKLDRLTTLVDGDTEYAVTIDGVATRVEYDAVDMGLTNFTQGFAVYQLTMMGVYPATVTTFVPTTGKQLVAKVTLKASVIATVRLTSYSVSMESTTMAFDVSGGTISFVDERREANQLPPNIMEALNHTYYVKFERGRSSSTPADYGKYLVCALYEGATKVCDVPLEAVYGPNCTETRYAYVDAMNLRVMKHEGEVWLLNLVGAGQGVLTRINSQTCKVIAIHTLTSTAVVAGIKPLMFADNRLTSMHTLFGGNRVTEVERVLRVMAVSDNMAATLQTTWEDGTTEEMDHVDNHVCMDNDTAATWISTQKVMYPLSVKSRGVVLGTPLVKVKPRKR